MRILFFLAAMAIIGLVVTGAIKLQKGDDNTITIKIDRQQVREDAAKLVRKSKSALEEAESAFRDGERNTK